MSYSVNDPDVTTYLEALNALSVTIGTDTDTGAVNLEKIITVIEPGLQKLKYDRTDKLNHLNQRKLIVDNMIISLKDNLYNTNDLETRYQAYNQDVITVNTTIESTYMNLIQRTINTYLDSGMKQVYYLNREKKYLDYLTTNLQEEITYLKSLEQSLTTLKNKIENL
jgi:hypothetical protein